MSTLLEVEQLCVGYAAPHGVAAILRDISFTIDRGASLGIVGESGSGKSTLAAAIAGLLPKSGRITGGGIRTNMGNAPGRPPIGMVFQDPAASLHPTMTIGRQMQDVLRATGLPRPARADRAMSALVSVGLADPERIIGLYPHQLSGGMRQRVGIAMALLGPCELMIADEPTAALDVTVEAHIIDLLIDLRGSRGMALILIAHGLGIVSRLCEQVIVLYGGEIVERGPTQAVLSAPVHPYTRALIACDPAVAIERVASFPTIAGPPPGQDDRAGGCIYRRRCSHAAYICRERPSMVMAGADHSYRCHGTVAAA